MKLMEISKTGVDFQPLLCPYQAMELGIFDGSYYGEDTEVTRRDFATPPTITKVNRFAPNASQPLSVWQEQGWIKEYDPMALYTALVRAVETYRHRDMWRELQLRCMQQDFSWERSARKYVELYNRARAFHAQD